MPTAFGQLLETTIEHLQTLQARGVRYVDVAPETLSALRDATPPAAALRSPAERPGAGRPLIEKQTIRASAPPKPATVAALPQILMPAPAQAADPAGKAQALAELRERALVCVKCAHLASTRKNVVFGVGDSNARLMFVGEAPGVDEDAQGEPFVGRAGELLTRIIQTMGLGREQVYIANILKCRPDTPAQTAGNRKPTADEMKTCIPYLHAQIAIIQPAVLVALGGTAMEGLQGKTTGITRLRGNWQTYRDIPLMPTFHPSYLLRNEALSEKRKVWEDMLSVMERLGLPISEKQQSFFLSRTN